MAYEKNMINNLIILYTKERSCYYGAQTLYLKSTKAVHDGPL